MKLKMCSEPRRGLLVFYQNRDFNTTWWDVTTLNTLFPSTVYCVYLAVQGNLVNTVTNGPKKLAVLKRVFFTWKCMTVFARRLNKSGRNNEVTITRGFTVFFTWVSCLLPNLGRKISLQKLPKFFGWPKRIKCVYPAILFQSLAY